MTISKMTLLVGAAAACLQLTTVATPADAKAETLVRTSGDGKAKTTTTASSASPNSDANYLDDRLMWDHSTTAWSYDELMNGEDPGYCLPRNTLAIGQSSSLTTVTKTTTSTSDDGKSSAKPATSDKKYLPVIVDPNRFLWGAFGGYTLDQATSKLEDANKKSVQLCEGVASPKPLIEGQELYVDPTDALRWGWQYGALVVPFKMQLGGNHAFSGSASVGAFLGYKVPLWNWGLALSPVAFAGASSISVPTNGGGNTTQTMAGLSYGVGLIGEVKDGFQVGIIFGKDHVDSGNYLYNDKTWVSFEIGYSFAQ